MEGNFKQKSTVGACLKIGSWFILKIGRLEEDMTFGNIRFQKCVPSEGYREQTWRKKTIGSFIKCDSRQGRQESVHFGAVFIKIRQLGIFGGQNFQLLVWRDLWSDNLGNYLRRCLNVIPARIFHISLYFLRIKFVIFAWFSLNFLRCSEMEFFGISVMGG